MKYLVRFGIQSKAKVVDLNDDGVRFAKEAGYQIAPLEQKMDELITDTAEKVVTLVLNKLQ